ARPRRGAPPLRPHAGRGHPTLRRVLRDPSAAGARTVAATVTCHQRQCHVTVYSGPLPPSGGVSRPPLAVVAPHRTQFDGARFTSTISLPASSRPAGAPAS